MIDNHNHRLVLLKSELEQITEAQFPERTWDTIKAWIAKATPIIRRDWSDFLDDFQKVSEKPSGAGIMFLNTDFTMSDHEQRRLWRLDNDKAEQVKQNILGFLDGILALAPQEPKETALDKLKFICQRFPIFAHQLKFRERGREALVIEDEYDLQYLLLALLRMSFDDVRPEVWTPSYAGGSARMDFLLKPEKIIIEAKRTRANLRDREVGDQLIVDIERYAEYPDYHILICFVYDPEGMIENPRGLERDLSSIREKIEVIVVVSR